MAQDNQSISVGKKGMNRDVHPSNLTETEYSIAFNANYEDESGNGYPMLQTEHSNILCTTFKEGYKVIGFKHDLNEDRTYYFLTNPTTGTSEVGYISSVQYINNVADIEKKCDCDIVNKLDTPLEEQLQSPTCEYVTIIEDSCNNCLNFSIDHPIKEGNIQIKDEKCGKTLYWTDDYNPQRYLNLSNLSSYRELGTATCEEEVIETCVDCDKLRLFPNFEKPCIIPTVIQFGGNLKAGTYEFLVAYSDKAGNEISQYYSITNPISIFDPNNNILDQTELAYTTNLGIRLRVTDLDTNYGYYKVAVIQRADVNGATSYFEVGVYSTTDDNVFYTTDLDSQRTTLNKLLTVRPTYTHTEGMTSSNGYLFQYGLKAQGEYNLQPVVNLMGAFLKWQTVVADENLYKDGVNNSLYRSYMRDEVYPFSIRFFTKDGFETALFPLIGRPPSPQDLQPVDNKDTDSIKEFAPNCAENTRNERWQYYNTAEVEGVCTTQVRTGKTITQVVSKTCNIESVGNITGSTVIIPINEEYNGLKQYIEDNREAICDEDSLIYNDEICQALLNSYPSETCTPTFEGNCGEITLVEEEVFIQDIDNETTNRIGKPLADYIPAVPPTICDIYEIDRTNGGTVRDIEFQREFMLSSVNGVIGRTYRTALDRKPVGNNVECRYATRLFRLTDPTTAVGQSIFLDYYGGNEVEELQLDNESCEIDGFTNRIHKGARWYRGEFNSEEQVIFEATRRTTCTETDDIPLGNTLLRATVYDNCDSSPIQCEVIDTERGGLIELNRDEFTSDSFYVVIDAPIVELNTGDNGNPNFEISPRRSKWRTTPPCGCISLFLRNVEHTEIEVSYDAITIGKRQAYESTCEFDVPTLDDCRPIPFEYGKFSYWQSTETYPDNKELYDSSTLKIEATDIPDAIRAEFEEYFTQGSNSDSYILDESTDFTCKPIRHFKFPSNEVTPFMGDTMVSPFQRSLIYPIGVTIDVDVINAFLDIATKQGLITFEERSKIVKYEIFRGDRALNRSVIAKGLLYDTYKYKEEGEDIYYPNYPYNDLGTDVLNYEDEGRSKLTPHPYGGTSNNRFTFHSPDVHFNKPTLPNEVSIDGYQFGNSRGNFVDVEGHSKWVILGRDAYSTATTLAVAEVLLEAAIKVGELLVTASQGYWFIGGVANGTGAAGAGIGTGTAIALGVAIGADAFMRAGRYRYEWLRTFRDNGQLKQFASYYTSEGYYNHFKPNTVEGDKVRGLATRRYLKSGRYSIVEENTGTKTLFNNIDRESSVYMSFGDEFLFNYPDFYSEYDNYSVDQNTNSRTTSELSDACAESRSKEIERQIASPYVAMKNYLPSQYGDVEGVKWVPTGYCGRLIKSEECQVIFGGDTFISRFSLKRKVPMFLVNAVDQAPRTPFNYLQYRNIGSPRFYCDYDTEQETTVLGTLFPELGSEFNFDCETGANRFYVRPPSKFYLFYYGIPQFLVESEINTNYRYARKEVHENFYPNFSDYTEWTQEKTVSIKQDNTYYYNDTYSKNTTMVGTRVLPSTYEKDLYDCLFDAPNGVIYSLQDSSEQDITDPWLIYRPLDFYQFPTSAGKLIDLKGIESAQVLGRFENQVILFNAVDTIRDRLTSDAQELGNGGIFATRPLEFKRTDLGYAGTQHKSMVSCEFGHFWTDAKRGQVFQVDQNGKNLREITNGLRNWFKEHLPFKFLRGNTEGFSYEDLDNTFKGIGVTMGWDSRYKRVFLTKRDYIVKKPIFTVDNAIYSVETRDKLISENEILGYSYTGVDNGRLRFTRGTTEVEIVTVEIEPLLFNNTEFFVDVSFTLAYSPLTESWVSYYSFKPDYYVSYHNYFQTGKNFSIDPSEDGLWSHLLSNKSYYVFYGKKYGWLIELPIKETYANKVLKSVEYWMDTRRYHNEFDFAERRNIGFNKAWIYNHSVNSGQLNLITELKNNLNQKLNYPIVRKNSQDILATQNDKKWTFNYFFNQVRNELNNVPIWKYDENQINKFINKPALKYNKTWQDRLRGDWFLMRLANDSDSRFKQIFKWSNSKESIYT